MKQTFHLTLKPNRSSNGKILSLSPTVTTGRPTTVAGDALVLKLTMDIPESAFGGQELTIVLQDKQPDMTTIVADLQKWAVDLSSEE